MNRVVVTGMGVTSPVGRGREESWRSLVAGRSGIGPIRLFDASALPVRIGGEVESLDFREIHARYPEVQEIRDRKVGLGLVAADEAIHHSGIAEGRLVEALLSVGLSLEVFCLEDVMPVAAADDLGRSLSDHVLGQTRPPQVQVPLDAIARCLGAHRGFRRGRITNVSACAAGTQAIGEAFHALREEQAEVALAGAADSMLNPLGLGGFSLLQVLSSENERPESACRPFDRSRQGTVLGEGSAFLVLETVDHAIARGAAIHAEVLGYGSSLDAYRVSDPAPDGRGAILSMRAALRDAGLGARDVDCVNAHGTGTPKNDAVETLAIKAVLGARAREIPVHSVKSMTGHLIAASGALEAVVAVLTIVRGEVPPTRNLLEADPACDLDYVPGAARPFRGRVVLSNSFGFGGQNATLVLGRYEP